MPFAPPRSATTRRSETNRYVGTVQARHEVDEAFRVGGKVVQRKVDVGQNVREGDVLAVLDDTDYRLAEEAAQQAARRRHDAGAPGRIGPQAAQRVEDRRLGQRLRRREGAHRRADGVGSGRGGGEEARACTQSAEVHGAARVAERRGHRGALRGRTGRAPRASRSSRSPTRASRRSWSTCPRITWPHSRSSRYKAWLASAPEQTFEVVLRELSPQAAAQTRTFRARLKPVDAAAAAARRDRHARRRAHGRRSAGGRDPCLARSRRATASPRSGWFAARAASRPATVDLTNVVVHGYRNDEVLVSGPPAGDAGRHRRRAEDGAGLARRASRRRAATPKRSRPRDEIVQPHRMGADHRAIVLFLILVIAIGGVLGFTQARPARRPELLRAVDDGDGDLARRDGAADPGRGAQPHGEEVRAARPLREGQDLRAPGLRRHDDHGGRRHLARRTSARPGTRRARSSATSSSSCPKASSARSSTTNTAT